MKSLKLLFFPCMDKLLEASDRRDKAVIDLKEACEKKDKKFNGMVSCGMSAMPIFVRENI